MSTPATLQIKAALRIARPDNEVFEAIVNPEHMSQYFISQSSGRMQEGISVQWQFPEMDLTFPVQVRSVEPHKRIAFSWTDFDGTETLVEMNLKAVPEEATLVEITEGERANNEAGIRWLKSNTEGWANFLACLKAYMEYGINLRKGAFDPSQMPVPES